MSTVLSHNAITAIMNHLLKTHDEIQAKEILLEKYPHLEGMIETWDILPPPTIQYKITRQKTKEIEYFKSFDYTLDDTLELDVNPNSDPSQINCKEVTETITKKHNDDKSTMFRLALNLFTKLLKEHGYVNRKDFIHQLDMNPNTANQYFYKCRHASLLYQDIPVDTRKMINMSLSLYQQSKQLYENTTDKSRKNIQNLFITQLGLNPRTASTYYTKLKANKGS